LDASGVVMGIHMPAMTKEQKFIQRLRTIIGMAVRLPYGVVGITKEQPFHDRILVESETGYISFISIEELVKINCEEGID